MDDTVNRDDRVIQFIEDEVRKPSQREAAEVAEHDGVQVAISANAWTNSSFSAALELKTEAINGSVAMAGLAQTDQSRQPHLTILRLQNENSTEKSNALDSGSFYSIDRIA